MKLNLSRFFSLKILLTVPFVVQMLIVVGSISWLADRSARQVVNHLTFLLLEDIGDRLQTEIDHFLAKPITLTQDYQDLIDLELLNLNDLDPWGPYLYKQYLNHQNDYLTGFMLSNQANEFRAAGHTYSKEGERIQGLAVATRNHKRVGPESSVF